MSSRSISDAKTVNLVLKGDIEKYELIVKKYEDPLLRYASTILSSDDDAKDAVQTSFIKAYRNLNSYNSRLKFSSWIYRIVHNESLNMIKKNKKYITTNKDLIMKLIPSDELTEIEKLNKKEISKMVMNNIDQLPLNYKEALTLYYLQEKSYQEISDILRIPLNTVKTRLRRSKNALKQLIERKEI